ncbi:MAG: hypothetical protein ACRDK3_15075 [Actinomycetota bacterium]
MLLAGPILRRTTAERAYIWLATSDHCSAHITVGLARNREERVGGGTGEMVRLGPRLFVHLLEAAPRDGEFPTNTLLAYDLTLESGGDTHTLGDLGLLDGEQRIALGGAELPTFFIRGDEISLHLLHGSCRQLHGGGEDAFLAAEGTLVETAGDVGERPSALFLTGDQIYADDVAAPLIGHLRSLATALAGENDASSIPGIDSLDELPVNGRSELMTERAGFTSDKAGNHLLSFGEWAAMYTLAWNPELWPESLPPAGELIGENEGNKAAGFKARRKAESQRKSLERARAALPAVRRVLANIPTYMIFDDHDVTDDWNLTGAWRENAARNPTGRRVVANALAAYWAFQGWGNSPGEADGELAECIGSFVSGSSGDGDAFDETMWSFDRWSYAAPLEPPAVVLDTRTQRHYDSPEGGARLIRDGELRRVSKLAADAGHEPGTPLILISPVPVFGFEFQERRQKYLVGKLGPYEIDFEAWHSNLRGLVDFMRLLIEELRPDPCVILSGDVHYGVNAEARFSIHDRELDVVQLVSSGFKHANLVAKAGLNGMGHFLRTKHERLGWDKPPDHEAPDALSKKILFRPVNVDEWADDSPVFLAPRHVELLGIEAPPDFRECRVYVRPEGRARSVLIGENNLGLVTLGRDGIVHRVLSRGHDTHVHRARISRPATKNP